MKRKTSNPHPEWDLIFPLIIARWRKMMKLPLGPADRLQTREFQTLIQNLLAYRESKDLSSKESLGAYLFYEWPLHYAEGLSLLKELPKTPDRVLELGAKGAAFSLAALQHGAREAFALDENESALVAGAD
ncbi:MAG: class I SAM-dependent methyltransferase, partial [Verrucomicrobia bacterium]|nr:class I SAM-dependent methyltransferase [Verrucomicrobiota bacterium]